MNLELWKEELARFKKLTPERKTIWSALLLFEISMCARGTYEPGTDSVLYPKELRRFNELFHRLTSWQRDMMLSESGIPDDDIFDLIAEELDYLKVPSEPVINYLRKFGG